MLQASKVNASSVLGAGREGDEVGAESTDDSDDESNDLAPDLDGTDIRPAGLVVEPSSLSGPGAGSLKR